MKTILIVTFGTYGDIHPFLSLAIELKARGHRVIFCTSDFYEAYITKHGIECLVTRPGHGDNHELLQKGMHPTKGPEFLVKEWLAASVNDTYEDLCQVADQADLIINHITSLVGPIIAEKFDIPIIACTLAPAGIDSVHDPLIIAITPWLSYKSWMGKTVYKSIHKLANYVVAKWLEPVTKLRAELKLDTSRNPYPFVSAKNPVTHNLILYSSIFGTPQPDWPTNFTQTGFPLFPQAISESQQAEVEYFLKLGLEPITFTLGTGAVHAAGSFYKDSAQVLKETGHRGIMLTGRDTNNLSQEWLSPKIAAFDYLPLDYVFSRSKIAVHQGGIGTCTQALYAGIPMIVIPHSVDQPDNAYRLMKLGVAEVIPARHFSPKKLRYAIESVYDNEKMIKRAQEIKHQLMQEDGVKNACDAIERVADQNPIKLSVNG